MAIGAAVAAGVAVAGVAASTALKARAAGQQADANKKAARTVGDFRQQVLDYQQKIYGDTQPFRDISLHEAQRGSDIRDATTPYLLSNLLGPETPGERGYGADFDLASKEGLDSIQRNFAVTGSPSSGPAQIAAGRFQTGLVANEQRRIDALKQQRIDNIFRLSGLDPSPNPTTGIGESTSALNIAGQGTQDLAGLQIQQGAITASKTNAYADAAQQVGSIAASYGTGGYGSGFSGAGGSSGGAINTGGFAGAGTVGGGYSLSNYSAY